VHHTPTLVNCRRSWRRTEQKHNARKRFPLCAPSLRRCVCVCVCVCLSVCLSVLIINNTHVQHLQYSNTYHVYTHTHIQEILRITAQAQQELLEEQQKHERDQFKILQQVRIVQHTPRTYTHHSHTQKGINSRSSSRREQKIYHRVNSLYDRVHLLHEHVLTVRLLVSLQVK